MILLFLTKNMILNIGFVITLVLLFYINAKVYAPKLSMEEIDKFLLSKGYQYISHKKVKRNIPPEHLFQNSKFLQHRYSYKLSYYQLICYDKQENKQHLFWVEVYKNWKTYVVFEEGSFSERHELEQKK